MTYIDADFTVQLATWDPERERRLRPNSAAHRAREALQDHPAGVTERVMLLVELYLAGDFPELSGFQPAFAYALVDDFGAELGAHIEARPEALALARSSVGLGDDGGGVRSFVDRAGLVQHLDMGELPHYWQPSPFPDVDTWWWAMFQHQLVQDGVVTAAEFVERCRHRGCLEAVTAHIDTRYGASR